MRPDEDDEHAQPLVADEPMLGSRGDKRCPALGELHRPALDLERAASVEDDVDHVILVRFLPIGLRRDEDVDAELEAARAVDDLVAAFALGQLAADLFEVDAAGPSAPPWARP
jgi:hypothetical protein